MKILWLTQMQLDEVNNQLNLQKSTGQAGWVENLAKVLKKHHGVELSIATYSSTKFEPFTSNNIKYYCIHWKRSKAILKRKSQPQSLEDKLKSILHDCQPNLIHVHGSESALGSIVHLTDVPVVISMQGIVYGILKYVFAGLNIQDITGEVLSTKFLRGTSLIHGYRYTQKVALREIEIVKSNKHFIGRTDWDKELISVVNPSSTYYHCDEIMRPCFYEGNWKSDLADENVIYTTSSSMNWKGTEILLEAISILQSSGFRKISLRIAGVQVNQVYGKILYRRSKKLRISESITWLERLGSNAIRKEILNAGIFVYPSHIDNSPNALVEAMLLGAPCIATYAGGIPSLITNGKEGLLYQDSDPYALAGRIRRLLKERDYAQNLGVNARIRALGRNDPAYIADQTIEIYRAIMNSNTSANVLK